MSFNKEQAQAVNASCDKDILIAAGAGSGKTKTLSTRVERLVKEGLIKPEELLVLTFTNNAAYEMKTRILSLFGKEDPNYGKMLSSHVQSFDSFNAYLVRLYSGRLRLSPGFSILGTTLAEQRKREEIERVLNDAYLDVSKRGRLVSFMSKLGLKNPAKVGSYILNILKNFDLFTPEKRQQFLLDYAARVYSPDHVKGLYHRVIAQAKASISSILREAFVLDNLSHLLVREVGEEASYEEVLHALDAPYLWTTPLEECSISQDVDAPEDFLNDEFSSFLRLLSLGDEEFPCACREILSQKGAQYFATIYKGKKRGQINDCSYHELAFKCLKGIKAILADASSLGSYEEERERMGYFQDGIALLLELTCEVNARLDEYRKAHNAFTFADVTALALSLFIEEEYEDIAEELRNRFRYIMVDEYQDTNDFQELFLEGLLKPNKEGTRAHLFCVGDAKQSIYAFRNSNVELFRARQRRYLGGRESDVIAMNKNYRSAELLLDDINYIFSYYMTPRSGGIDYLNVMERLTYDPDVNLYNVPLDSYGVHRILPPDSFAFTKKSAVLEDYSDMEFEARAILSDIQDKLKAGFPVFERGKGVRPCKLSDFCILMRRKRSVVAYQKLFNEAGIALNNKVSVNLREVNAVMLLQSLFNVIAYILKGEPCDLRHAFASIARSYIYEYDDTTLHRILSGDGDASLSHIKELIECDPIMLELHRFAHAHEDEPLSMLFASLVSEFHIIDKLCLVGDIEDNVSKIESLYAMILNLEALGKGLCEFVRLFKDINKRALDISSDSVVESSDAVDLMTIHASKGLERKIVYIPSSDNGVSQGSNFDKPPFDFSYEDGLSFPYLYFPFDNFDEDTTSSYKTLPLRAKSLSSDDEEAQEHVRLLYVALTRAENAVYVVGRDKGKRSAYVMYENVPSRLWINPNLLGLIPSNIRQAYEYSLKIPNLEAAKLEFSQDEPSQEAYERLRKTYVLERVNKNNIEMAKSSLEAIYDHCVDKLSLRIDDLDLIAKIYASAFFPARYSSDNIHDFLSLHASLNHVQQQEEEDNDEAEEGEEGEEEASSRQDFRISREDLANKLIQFAKSIIEGDMASALPQIKLSEKDGKDEELKKQIMIDALLSSLAKQLLGVSYVCYRSYSAAGYKDEVRVFDALFAHNANKKEPHLAPLSINDEEIVFPRILSKRASKKMSDEDFVSDIAIERGNRLHRYLELLDFTTFDTSFIPEEKERRIVECALNTELMQQARKAKSVYREYGFYDEENLTTGYIDMFFIDEAGIYHIVDYKSSNIFDEEYDEQLRAYGRNIMRLFKVRAEKLRLHLLSIGKSITRDVALYPSED